MCWEKLSLCSSISHQPFGSSWGLPAGSLRLLAKPQAPMSSHPPPCYPPGRALESSNPPTAPSPAIAGAAPDRTSLSAGWVSGTWALWRGQGGILTLSLWMMSSSFQKPTGPSYLGSPCPDWEMCRKQGLKTTWKNWPGQGARKKCQSEQGCWEVRR